MPLELELGADFDARADESDRSVVSCLGEYVAVPVLHFEANPGIQVEVSAAASKAYARIEFVDEDTGLTFIPDSIIIKLDIAQTYLEYSFSTGATKTVHGRVYSVGNAAPPNGVGQETVSENNVLATKMYIRADDANAIARIWANKN